MTRPFQLVREIVIEGMERGEVKEGDFFGCAASYAGAILRPAQLHLECVLPRSLQEMADGFIQNAWASIKA